MFGSGSFPTLRMLSHGTADLLGSRVRAFIG
jgi:hypothetical protein